MGISERMVANTSPEKSILYSRVAKKIVPLMVVAYFISFLDRVNIGFAKFEMARQFAISDTAYGIGAGIFFAGYFIVQWPSGYLARRFGPAVVLPSILVLWSLVSAATIFVTDARDFYLIRFLLGLTEGGLVPCVLFYFKVWFPASRQGRIMSFFYLGMPIGIIVGGPLSGFIIQYSMQLGRFKGWQWMFIIEALPALILGIYLFFKMDPTPERASWLDEGQRREMSRDREREKKPTDSSLGELIREPALIPLMLISLLHNTGNYGLIFWVSTLVRNLGYKNPLQIGIISAIPYAFACLILITNSGHSQRKSERRFHTGLPILLGGLALAVSAIGTHSTLMAVVLLSIAVAGSISSLALFWAIPGRIFSSHAIAGSVAAINGAACVAGFLGPVIMGVLSDMTGNTARGIQILSISLLLSGILILTLPARAVGRFEG